MKTAVIYHYFEASDVYKDNLFWIILYPLFATSFLILILYFFFPKLLSVSKPNEKTSVIHKDFLRGYGIIFPLSVLPSFLIFTLNSLVSEL